MDCMMMQRFCWRTKTIKEVNKWETEMQNIFLPLYITMKITLITTYPSIPSTIYHYWILLFPAHAELANNICTPCELRCEGKFFPMLFLWMQGTLSIVWWLDRSQCREICWIEMLPGRISQNTPTFSQAACLSYFKSSCDSSNQSYCGSTSSPH